MFKSLIAILVASISLSAFAQEATQSTSNEEIKRLVPRAKAGVRSAAALESLALTALDQFEANVNASSATDEEKAKLIEKIKEQRTQIQTQVASLKKTLASLGVPYAVLGVVVTAAAELIPAKWGHSWGMGLGGQGEVGVIGTVFSSGAPRFSFVALGGPLLEGYTEVNVTQNKVGFDSGIHVKFIFANIINSTPITHARDLIGWYVGGGIDIANGPSGKAYVGGCGNHSASVASEFPEDGTVLGWLRSRVRNCNTIMVSLSMSFNKNAPPVAIPFKPFYMWITDANNGDGWVPFERK